MERVITFLLPTKGEQVSRLSVEEVTAKLLEVGEILKDDTVVVDGVRSQTVKPYTPFTTIRLNTTGLKGAEPLPEKVFTLIREDSDRKS
jgi:hypothetical protein